MNTRMSRVLIIAALIAASVIVSMALAAGQTLSGAIHDAQGNPVVAAFLLLVSPNFQFKETAIAGGGGAFTIKNVEPGDYLVIQPPSKKNADGINAFALQPRILRMAGETQAGLVLPPGIALVLKGYDTNGKSMRVRDYEARGKFGSQYTYATNLQAEMVPAVSWWVHDKDSGLDQSKENGLPALIAPPGGPYAIHVLFWEVPGYGKLLLSADNAGKGFSASTPGQCILIEINVELARTAVNTLIQRKEKYAPGASPQIDALAQRLQDALAKDDPKSRAAAADQILAEALRLRDDLEFAAAQAAIPQVRMGQAAITITNADGAPVPGCKIEIAQQSHDFLFGGYEGSPYYAKGYEMARQAGFELATVLLGWNWTLPEKQSWDAIDATFGVSQLKDLGYKVKAHGVIYLQGYGITPDSAMTMDKAQLPEAILKHQRQLLDSPLGSKIDIWEVINEAGVTNILGIPQNDVIGLIGPAAANIKELTGLPTLINSAHEINFGQKYMIYDTTNRPAEDYPLTYSTFLNMVNQAGNLDKVDIIGLQIYPGTHLSDMFGGIEGPAFTPSAVLDTIERYARFGKDIHITEFCLPGSYGPTWNCGYWRNKWDEDTQAQYADYVYTMAFGNPNVHSVTWWGISAKKPDVVTGNLFDAAGKPKPVGQRIQQRIQEWTTNASAQTGEQGQANLQGFAGQYTLTVTPPTGDPVTQTFHIAERGTVEVSVQIGSTP